MSGRPRLVHRPRGWTARVRTASETGHAPYFRLRTGKPRGECPGGWFAPTLRIMADSTPSAQLDRMTDLAYAALSVAGGTLLLITSAGAQGAGWIPGPAPAVFGVDAGLGLAAAALFRFRRRWPVGIAVAVLVPMMLARSAQVAGVLSVLNVTLRRRPVVAVAVAGAHQVAFIGFILLWITYPWWAAFLWILTYHVVAIALGLYCSRPPRARRVAARAGPAGGGDPGTDGRLGPARRAGQDRRRDA